MEKLLKFNLQLFATPVQPGAANSFDYTATDRDTGTNFGKLLLPKLRKIFFEVYDEVSEQFSKVYKVNTSTKAKEFDWGMGAFGDWTARADQFAEVAYATLSPGVERVYTHKAFTQGFMVTREMFDDDQYRQMEKLPAAMARSGRAKVEKDAISLLINAFSADVGGVGASAIYNGQPLCGLLHPLLDHGTKKGINKVAGALSDTSLKAAIKVMRETVDEAGNVVTFRPTKLIVPPALHDTAIRLLESTLQAGTANNDTNNYLKGFGIEIVVLDYLSTAAGGNDAYWFLVDGDRHELNFFWRVKPEFKWDEDFDTFVAKYRGYMRYSFGVSDWRGIVGSPGV